MVGDPLPGNITSVSVNLNFSKAELLPGSRYHLYVALYYQIPSSTSGGITYSWLDTQSRAENIGGVDSLVGKVETYDLGDSFGWDNVSVIIDPLQSGTISADVQNQCTKDLLAWGLNPSTPCVLKGIEIGTEGFQINNVDVDWFNYTFVQTVTPSSNITNITINHNSTNTTTNQTNSTNQTSNSSFIGTFNSSWFTNNCGGAGTGTEQIVNGVLQTRESTPAGNSNNYGYCSTLRGSFPWGTVVGDPLPGNITSVSVNLNFSKAELLPGSRYHLYVALYYQIPSSTSGGITYSWLDTQSRAENIGGVDSLVGKVETYDLGDSFGWDNVSVIIDPLQSGTISADVQNQCTKDLLAWGLNPSTPCVLKGIEIGTEGFQINNVDVDWFNVSLVNSPPLINNTINVTNTTGPDNVVVILMENQGINDILGVAPFLTTFANTNALATQYTAVDHPSEPNYMALIGGDTFISGDQNCCWQISAQNLVDRLESAGKTWSAYAEDSSGNGSNFRPPRGADHFSFLEFNDINTPSRTVNFHDAGTNDQNLINELNTSSASNFIWLTPNDCNNMHDCSVLNGDLYLSMLVPKILTSQTFLTKKSALFIVFDEGNSQFPSDYVYAVWAGNAVKPVQSSQQYSHYSFLATLEKIWGMQPLTSNDASANPMLEFFK